ncbi:MAG: GyrI-like domain-containing protein, partial [Bryobacteraceae bacterium]
TIKMTYKFGGKQDYKVCGLEGLWWCADPEHWMSQPRESWQWKLMIRVPEFLTARNLKEAAAKLVEKGKGELEGQVRLERITEGRSVQVLHIGSYADESETLKRMEAFAEANGLKFRGRHHEIYLSDPRRVAPEKLRTILRHPVG